MLFKIRITFRGAQKTGQTIPGRLFEGRVCDRHWSSKLINGHVKFL